MSNGRSNDSTTVANENSVYAPALSPNLAEPDARKLIRKANNELLLKLILKSFKNEHQLFF